MNNYKSLNLLYNRGTQYRFYVDNDSHYGQSLSSTQLYDWLIIATETMFIFLAALFIVFVIFNSTAYSTIVSFFHSYVPDPVVSEVDAHVRVTVVLPPIS